MRLIKAGESQVNLRRRLFYKLHIIIVQPGQCHVIYYFFVFVVDGCIWGVTAIEIVKMYVTKVL